MTNDAHFQKMAAHHDKMGDIAKKVCIALAMPAAFLFIVMLCTLIVMSAGVVANVAEGIGQWAREASQSAVQPYALALFKFCVQAILAIMGALSVFCLGFGLYMSSSRTWPRR